MRCDRGRSWWDYRSIHFDTGYVNFWVFFTNFCQSCFLGLPNFFCMSLIQVHTIYTLRSIPKGALSIPSIRTLQSGKHRYLPSWKKYELDLCDHQVAKIRSARHPNSRKGTHFVEMIISLDFCSTNITGEGPTGPAPNFIALSRLY